MPFDASVRAYLRAYQNEYRAALHGGQHTAELSFRVPMHEMFRRIAHDLNPAGTFDIILEPRNQGRMGRPDWRMVLVNGVQLLSSSFFTAIGKSLRGALLALTWQTFFLIPLTLLLPLRFGIMGVLLAGPVADFSAFVLSVVLVGIELKKQKNSLII